MLYTVRPLERVYADPRKDDIEKYKNTEGAKNAASEDDYRDVTLPHGRIVTRRSGKDYVVERINSTDMSDYLNEEYTPGKVMKNKE